MLMSQCLSIEHNVILMKIVMREVDMIIFLISCHVMSEHNVGAIDPYVK